MDRLVAPVSARASWTSTRWTLSAGITRRPHQADPEPMVRLTRRRRAPFLNEAARERLGSLDIDGVVQRHQGLEGGIGAWTVDRTYGTARGVERDHRGIRRRAAPVG